MCETLIHLYPADYVTTQWSGGATTQLRIFPEDAVYADRDFLWRISSATVAVKESDFTALPDYHRLISVLEGEMTLTHNSGESVTLRPGDVHEFEGSDTTRSVGMCTDFNLMLRRDQAEGTMETVCLQSADQMADILSHADEMLLYCADGTCTAACQGKQDTISKGEALRVIHPDGAALTLKTTASARLMLCRMRRI